MKVSGFVLWLCYFSPPVCYAALEAQRAQSLRYMRISEARQNGSVLIMPLGALRPLVTEGNGWLNLWVLFLWGLSAFCLLAID